MGRFFFAILSPVILGLACQALFLPASTPGAATAMVTPTQPTPAAAETPTLTPAPTYPPEGLGPADFPADVDPLTGLKTADPALLERRPVTVKVSNLPRNVRPQLGLSLADMIYEYYIEEGTTRFAAIFLGRDANQVGDIRSARFFDEHLIRMYKGLFAFGSGDERVRNRLYTADFANRLILEWQAGCPAMCRANPPFNWLVGNTSAISAYATQKGIPNGRQNLDGMFFQAQPPASGAAAQHVYVWYSAVIYNRWDYDPANGRYLRFSDMDNAVNGQPETYSLLTDRLTGQPIAADTLVVLLMPHSFFSKKPEMVEMAFSGSGVAYAFRDGQAYPLAWQRPAADSVVYLTFADGRRFPFKPGVTWFEVMGSSTLAAQDEQGWHFHMRFP